MANTIQSFIDPVTGTQVVFDDDLAIEVPAEVNMGIILDRAGFFARTGVTPEMLGVEVTLFAKDMVHPRFKNMRVATNDNVWAWVSTIGATGATGMDVDDVMAAVVAGIHMDESAK